MLFPCTWTYERSHGPNAVIGEEGDAIEDRLNVYDVVPRVGVGPVQLHRAGTLGTFARARWKAERFPV